MRRDAAAFAEVAGRVHEANAEMVVPETVHQHAAREWVRGMRNPLGQREAALALGLGAGEVGGRVLHASQHTGRDFLLRVLGVAAPEHFHHGRLGAGDGINLVAVDLRGERGGQLLLLRTQGLDARAVGGGERLRFDSQREFRVAEEEQVVTDAVPAIGGDERERLGGVRERYVHAGGLVLAQLELLEEQLLAREHAEVRAGRSSRRPRTEADQRGEAELREAAGLANLGEVERDAGVRVQAEERVAVRSEVHAVERGGDLGVQRAVANSVPRVAGGGR